MIVLKMIIHLVNTIMMLSLYIGSEKLFRSGYNTKIAKEFLITMIQ